MTPFSWHNPYAWPRKPLLAANSLDEQRAYFRDKLAPIFDRNLIRWVTSKPASLYGLGIPPSQGTHFLAINS